MYYRLELNVSGSWSYRCMVACQLLAVAVITNSHSLSTWKNPHEGFLWLQGDINIYEIYADICVSAHAQAETRQFAKQVTLLERAFVTEFEECLLGLSTE